MSRRYTGTLDQPSAILTISPGIDGIVEVLLAQPATTGATTVDPTSDQVQLPTATIAVASTSTFVSAGTVFIVTTQPNSGLPGVEAITYTGKTGTTFTGCTGGLGVLNSGAAVSGSKVVQWAGVDRWLTFDGLPPTLKTTATARDHLYFRSIGGLIYGSHTNAQGLTGARGNPGAAGLQNRGAWAAGTSYVLNDVVTYLGATYISIQAGTGQTPAVGSTFWDLVASGTATTTAVFKTVSPGAATATGTSFAPTATVTGGTRNVAANLAAGTGTAGQPTPSSQQLGSNVGTVDTAGVAAQLINWMSSKTDNVMSYTDQQLQFLGHGPTSVGNGTPLGMVGLTLMQNQLHGMGASPDVDWTGDSSVSLAPAQYVRQQTMTNNNFVARCHAAGLTHLYLGNYLMNYNQADYTPLLGDWFNDSLWANTIIPALQNVAAGARLLGMNGVAWDAEEYATGSGGHGTFDWNYTGNSHSEPVTRAQVKLRGQQVMTALLDPVKGFGPGVELLSYHDNFDGGVTGLEAVALSNQSPTVFAVNSAKINWYDGLTSVPGWGRIRVMDASLYFMASKSLPSANEETSMIINANAILANFSQNFSNWAYANSRISVNPFLWLGPTSGDGSAFTHNGCPTVDSAGNGEGLTMVQLARKYGMSGVIANYSNPGSAAIGTPATYTNYTQAGAAPHIVNGNFVPVYSAASAGIVDSTTPTLSGITVTRDNSTTVHASGTANDNLGIRAVRWSSGASSGAAVHTFVPTTTRTITNTSGTYSVADYTLPPASFAWHTTWVASGIPAAAGQTVVFTVEDIKGNAVQYSVVA